MTFRLWLDGDNEDGCVELGGLVPVMRAMQEWAEVMPESALDDEESWGAFFWLPNADDQDLPPEYVDKLREQVPRYMAEYGTKLSPDALAVLADVSDGLGSLPERHAEWDESELHSESHAVHSYSTVQVDLPSDVANALLDVGREVPDEALAEDGRELRPHVTVRYGLDVDVPDVAAAFLRGFAPFECMLGPLEKFPDSGKGYEVLYAPVEVPGDLARMNDALSALPHVDTQPEYRPHATVAYVVPGAADALLGRLLDQRMFRVDGATFIARDGQETFAPLLGRNE